MSQLYNDLQDYNPRLVRAAANALKLEVFELFMPPADALALREIKRAARSLITTTKAAL